MCVNALQDDSTHIWDILVSFLYSGSGDTLSIFITLLRDTDKTNQGGADKQNWWGKKNKDRK